MSDVAGSIKKLMLDGTEFYVSADVNIKEIGSAYEIEAIPTSGRNIKKMTKRVQTREGITILAGGSDFEILQELAERMTDFSMSYETAGGDVYRTVGFIELEGRETEENKATIKMFPRDKWEAFIKS